MLPIFSFVQRRTVLKVAAIGVIIYAALVLVWANLTPYLGLQVFGHQIFRVDEQPVEGVAPSTGDRISKIGSSEKIDSWPGYLNTIANLRDRYFAPIKIQSLESLASSNAVDVELGERRFVKIQFQSVGADEPIQTAWFAVHDLPWQKTAVSVLWAALQSAIFWMGWLVYRRRPADDGAALFFLSCILTVGAYIGGHHWLQLTSQPALIFVFALCAMALPQVNLHFYLLFPSPKKFVLRHPRLVLLFLYVVPGLLQVAVLWTIGAVISIYRHDHSATGRVVWHLALLRVLVWTYVGVSACLFAGCVSAVWHSYRSARQPVQRNQMRWILAGAAVASLFITYSLFLAWRDPVGVALGGATWAMFGASLAFTGAHAVSIARYRLTDVETIVQRGRVYLLISFFGSLAYYCVLLLLAFFSPQLAGATNRPEGLLISASVILLLLIANTVRASIQKALDRRFFREKHQLERTVRQMGEAVGQLADREAVWRRSLAVAADAVNAAAAAIYRRNGDEGFIRVAEFGSFESPEQLAAEQPIVLALEGGVLLQTNPGPVLPGDSTTSHLRRINAEIALPLCHDERLLGFVLFGRRDDGQYGADELTFLVAAAELVVVAVRSAETQTTLERLNEELLDKIARITRQQQRLEAMRRTSATGRDVPAGSFEELRGGGRAVRELAANVRKVAGSQATVLLRGESGTGKTLLAELLHRNSARAAGPFVTVHCASLSPGVLESELFGHVKGAFTGAHRDRIGRFQLADGGTLFLDEIGDISLDIQTKLLRVLQEMTFEPVGASTPKTVDVRLIAATNRPLEELIQKGRFREDLFYRLNVIGLCTPPLRDRLEDVLELALHFLRRSAQQAGKRIEGFDPDALDVLFSYTWPGNIRELDNAVQRAVVMADGPLITATDLPPELFVGSTRATGILQAAAVAQVVRAPLPPPAATHESPAAAAGISDGGAGLAEELGSMERQRLLAALDAAGGNKSQAARLLGYRRSTFCSKLKKFGIA